jgi:hypothetical protein
MHCPHCGIAFHDEWATVNVRAPTNEDRSNWSASITRCPGCKEETIRILHVSNPAGYAQPHVLLDFVAYPKAINRKPTPKEVPSEIKEHYEEASPLLPFSSKASAALSRRCLQSILRSHGYTQQDLAKQIDALLGEPDPAKAIPPRFGKPSTPSVTSALLSSSCDGSDHTSGDCRRARRGRVMPRNTRRNVRPLLR